MTNQVTDLGFDKPFTPKPDTEYEKRARKFLEDTGAKIKIVLVDHAPYFPDDKESRDIYRVTLKRNGKSYTFRFGQSLEGTWKHRTPTPYDVISCLTKYGPGCFPDFCKDYGYDEDSRKGEKIYKAVLKEWAGVRKVFGDVLEELRLID